MVNLDDEIKQLFLKTSYPKNVRISFPYDNYDDLTNENIVAESLEFTENISNQTPLKFGLCEASRLLFDTIDVGNLKGKTIDVTIELEYKDKTYAIPYGRFVVESHKRKAYYNYVRHAECYSMENLLESTNTISDMFKQLLSSLKFKTQKKLFLSEDDIISLAFPTLIGPSTVISSEEFDTRTNFSGDYTIKVSSKLVSYDPKQDDFIYAVRMNYQLEYIKRVKELVKLIPEENYSELNESNNRYIITGYNENSGSYSYTDLDNIDTVDLIDELFAPINKVYSGIHFVYLDFDNSYDSFIAMYPIASHIPVKIELYKNDVLLYDTGFYDNTVSLSRYDLYLFLNNDSNLFQINTVAKSIKMERTSSSGATSIVNRTVYVPDTKKLFEINTYDYLQAHLELKGVFGKISRQYGTIEEIKLTSESNTYPEDSVIPSDDQYMETSIAQVYDTSMCIDYLFDDDEKKLYKSIICNYKNTAGEEATYEYVIRDMTRKTKSGEPVYNIIDYIDYDISDNYIIKSKSWTEEQIRNLLSPLANALENFTYTIGSLEAVGLPYVEAGDQIEVLTPDGGYITYILTRTLRGINSLRDTLSSE